jgi:hypothetical protein
LKQALVYWSEAFLFQHGLLCLAILLKEKFPNLPMFTGITLLALAVSSAPVPDLTPATLNINNIATASLCIVAGLLLTTLGVRIYKLSLFLAAFILYSNIGTIAMIMFLPQLDDLISRLVPVGTGLMFGLVNARYEKFGRVSAAALGGSIAGLLIESSVTGGLLPRLFGFAMMGGIAILAGILVSFFEKRVLIPTIALSGAYLFCLGLDVFLKFGLGTGATAFLFTSYEVEATTYVVNNSIYIAFGAVAVLTIASIFTQIKLAPQKSYYL